MHTRLALFACFAISLSGFGCGAFQDDGKAEVRTTARKLLPFFATKPDKTLESAFAPSFLNEVPFTQLQGAFRDFHGKFGKALDIGSVRLAAPFKGEVEFLFANEVRVPALLVIESQPPHRIIGLKLLPPVVGNDKLDDIIRDLKALPGRTSFSLVQLGETSRALAGLNADQPLPVGSAFKLVVLATLVDEIQNQKRAWNDVVLIRPEWKSLSSGLLQDWPAGSPVTLHSLATLMISKSDNTAADHLLRTLGRDRIEAMQQTLGVQEPERNRPFLCSGEMFKIKLVLPHTEQMEYVKAVASARRVFLDTRLVNVSLDRARSISKPLHIDEVEWLFSTNDLCRIMQWLQRDETARAILSINPGLVVNADYWKYAGYKGGAETGVLSFALLLKNSKGAWFTVALCWNDPKQDVDVTRLMDLAQRVLRVAEKLPGG